MSDEIVSCIMRRPPLWSTVRVNTLKISMDEAKRRLKAILDEQDSTRKRESASESVVEFHSKIPDLLVVRGHGPNSVKPIEKEIYVDKDCGCAVMRGADVYAPGILASNEHFSAGDAVSVFMDLGGLCKRGLKRPYDGKRAFLGNGTAMFSRTEIFSPTNLDGKSIAGIGVLMTKPIWTNPRLDGAVVDDWGFVQNLPSVVCGHVLAPKPGDLVLDMCAAPGGKSTHLAILMKDQGKVICVDSSTNRIQELLQNVRKLSLTCIETRKMNAIDLFAETSDDTESPKTFRKETFDRILLDAPCSCTGQRPRVKDLKEKQKLSHVPLQRKLLKTAYKLLKRGGTMVYSTCSLEKEENENQIDWFLKEYPDMKSDFQMPFGDRESIGNGIQKFDPRRFCKKHKTETCAQIWDDADQIVDKGLKEISPDEDTIGFFIAKLIKV